MEPSHGLLQGWPALPPLEATPSEKQGKSKRKAEKKPRSISKRPAGRGAKIADDDDDDDDTEKNQGDVHGPQPQEDGGKDEDGDSSAQADGGSQLDGVGASDVASNASTGGF